jgi:hypothetical protein
MQGYEQNLRYEKQDWLEEYPKTARVAWRLWPSFKKEQKLPTEVSLWGRKAGHRTRAMKSSESDRLLHLDEREVYHTTSETL